MGTSYVLVRGCEVWLQRGRRATRGYLDGRSAAITPTGMSANRTQGWVRSRVRSCVRSSRAEALPVFGRRNESFDHFRRVEVAVELIQIAQPEIVAGVIEC